MSLITAPAGQRKASCLPNLTNDPTSADQAQVEEVSSLTYQQALDGLKRYGRGSDFMILLLLDDLATKEKKHGGNHADVAEALNSVVQRCKCLDKHREAEMLGKRALEIREAVHGKDHVRVAEQLINLGFSCWEQKKYGEAESYYQRIISIYEAKLEPYDLKIAEAKHSLGSCYFQQGKYKKAKELYLRALETYEFKLDPNNFLITSAKKLIDSCKKNIETGELKKRKQSTAHNRTSDAIDTDEKSTNLQGHVAAKKAKVEGTVGPCAITSSATRVVASTPIPPLPSDEAVPKESLSLIDRVVADSRVKIMAEIDGIIEMNKNSHLNLKQIIEELQAENFDLNEKLCRGNRKIEDLKGSLLTYERLVAETQTERDEKAKKLSSSEEKIKNLERSHQATLVKSAKLEAEIDGKNQRLSEAKATIETSERTIAELKAETAEKRSQLAAAQHIIDSRLSCSICVAKDANRMWSKCNHVATCEQCATELLRKDNGDSGNGVACPKCRTPGFPLEVFI